MRRIADVVDIGGVLIGGDHPIAIQSMTNTKTEDVAATVAQILALEKAGCEIVRCTVPTREAALAFRDIKRQIHIPLVADIHFDYRLAIAAMENGADKIRINPGNIGDPAKVRAVVDCARDRNIPIRVGVNSGSLEPEILQRDGRVTAAGLAESGIRAVSLIRDMHYDNLVLSVKGTDVPMFIEAHEILADRTRVPLHIGVTEAGTPRRGMIKSGVGLGALLSRGIGDTLRVSLTGDPVQEIFAAKQILSAMGLRKQGIEVISCPTCGRTNIDLIDLAERVEVMAERYPELTIKLAVMGCVVNGPGEAREADLGIAGGLREGLLIRKGEILKKVPEEELLEALEAEVRRLAEEQHRSRPEEEA